MCSVLVNWLAKFHHVPYAKVFSFVTSSVSHCRSQYKSIRIELPVWYKWNIPSEWWLSIWTRNFIKWLFITSRSINAVFCDLLCNEYKFSYFLSDDRLQLIQQDSCKMLENITNHWCKEKKLIHSSYSFHNLPPETWISSFDWWYHVEEMRDTTISYLKMLGVRVTKQRAREMMGWWEKGNRSIQYKFKINF